MNEIEKYTEIIFENIKHIDDDGNEYWSARELMPVLDYSKWERFSSVIEKAKEACKGSGYESSEHFPGAGKVLNVGNNATMVVVDYHLTRYACYLVAQNADPRKKTVALAQTYFAIQTRRQELFEKEYEKLSEDEKRLYHRNLTKKGNYILNQTAKKVGVKNFDKFHNAGYRGLYNGETADDIAKRKKLRYREDILDNMGSEELASNLFRIVQTESKLKKDNNKEEELANKTHYTIGKIVRNAIKAAGGTMPEELPTPNKSIKEIKENNKSIISKQE